MGRVTRRVPRVRFDLTGPQVRTTERPDTLVVEEPLEIRVDGRSVTTTMRTPGDDFDLTLGHLWSEGLLADPDDARTMMHCTDVDESGSPTFNVVEVSLRTGTALAREPGIRSTVASSACGVCGSQSIADVLGHLPHPVAEDPVQVDAGTIRAMTATLRDHQKVFAVTGGLHGAGLFTPQGECLVVREDVGRHNAVDKVIGWAAREGRLPLTGHVLVVSSRAGFEIVQKAVAAGIPILVVVSAATSLAVELAQETGLTIVGFAREGSLSAYSRPDRIVPAFGT